MSRFVPLWGFDHRISIVTVKEIVEDGKRLQIPMSLEVFKAAQKTIDADEQVNLL